MAKSHANAPLESKPLTAAQLAEAIHATVHGDGDLTITGAAPLDKAGPGDLSFLSNPSYRPKLRKTDAGAVVLSPADHASEAAHVVGKTVLVCDDPYYGFRNALLTLYGDGAPTRPQPGVSELAYVDPTAELGEGVCVQPFAYVGPNARIGDRTILDPHVCVGEHATIGCDCHLLPHVVVYHRCVLGDRVTLHAGCVIGQDGFGYATHQDKRVGESEPHRHHKIPQLGIAVIEDDVELGANCAIDRATLGETRIGQGTKASNLFTVGHGSEVGEHNLFVAQVGIAGSVKTGRYVVMGGQVGVANHLTIADGVKIAAQSGVKDSLMQAGESYGGSPAVPLRRFKRAAIAMGQLPDLGKEVRDLRKRLEALEAQLGSDQAD